MKRRFYNGRDDELRYALPLVSGGSFASFLLSAFPDRTPLNHSSV
jgi:hypothetical protein